MQVPHIYLQLIHACHGKSTELSSLLLLLLSALDNRTLHIRDFKHCGIVSTQAVLHHRHGMPSLHAEPTEIVSATHVWDKQTSVATPKIGVVMLDASTKPSS